jgi:plastocyanin
MPCRRALPIAGLLAVVVLLAAACSIADPTAGGAGHHHGHAAPPPAGAARAAPERAGSGRATGAPVRVVMNDRFRYQPASITVQAGHRVTFAVHNAGKLPHEFILGDRATGMKGTIVVLSPDRPTRLPARSALHA